MLFEVTQIWMSLFQGISGLDMKTWSKIPTRPFKCCTISLELKSLTTSSNFYTKLLTERGKDDFKRFKLSNFVSRTGAATAQ